MIERLYEGDKLTRRDIAVLFGGNARAFLPRVDGERIVAGCFDPEMNPRAPHEVLVHNSPNAILAAQRFIQQTSPTNATTRNAGSQPARNERGDRALCPNPSVSKGDTVESDASPSLTVGLVQRPIDLADAQAPVPGRNASANERGDRAPSHKSTKSSPPSKVGLAATSPNGVVLHSPPGLPIFLRRAPNVWEFIGRYRAVGYTEDPDQVAIRIYEIRPQRYERHVRQYGQMRGILFLEPAD